MEIISLKCNSCAADLQVNEKTKFFNCSFCGSSLALKRSGNAVFTEVLDEIKEDTSIIRDTSEKILLEKQIARLDRDWEKTAEDFETKEEEGTNSPFGAIIGALVFLFFIIIFVKHSTKASRRVRSKLFDHVMEDGGNNDGSVAITIASIFIGIIILLTLISYFSNSDTVRKKKQSFAALEKDYHSKRQALLNKIEEMD